MKQAFWKDMWKNRGYVDPNPGVPWYDKPKILAAYHRKRKIRNRIAAESRRRNRTA